MVKTHQNAHDISCLYTIIKDRNKNQCLQRLRTSYTFMDAIAHTQSTTNFTLS